MMFVLQEAGGVVVFLKCEYNGPYRRSDRFHLTICLICFGLLVALVGRWSIVSRYSLDIDCMANHGHHNDWHA